MKTRIESTIELGNQALQEQKYGKAETLFSEALQQAQTDGHGLLMTACLDGLGEIYFQQEAFEKAEPYFRRALDIRRKLLPIAHEDMVSSLNNLSATYFFQGKYKLAKPLCEQLLAIYETVLGKDHPEVATCLTNLGLISMSEGKLDNAEKHFREAHNIRSSTLEPADALIGNSLSHLGNTYFEQERYDMAADKFKQALSILEKHRNSDDPDLENIISKQIISLEKTGQTSELEELYHKLISLSEIHRGPAHSQVSKYLDKLANLYQKQNKHKEAEKIFQRLLSMKKRAFGDMHPEVANHLASLALIREALSQKAQAETFLLQALNIYENYKRKDLTGQSPIFAKYLETIKNLALFYARDSRFSKSEKQWQKILELTEPRSSVHPQILLEVYEHLPVSLVEQNRSTEAYALLEKSLHFLENGYINHLIKLTTTDYKIKQTTIITKLADILKAEGKYSEAEIYYKKALDILMKSLGSKHSALAPTMEGYADLLTCTYREAEAEHMLACARGLEKSRLEKKI